VNIDTVEFTVIFILLLARVERRIVFPIKKINQFFFFQFQDQGFNMSDDNVLAIHNGMSNISSGHPPRRLTVE
jgi:hypothetical protein